MGAEHGDEQAEHEEDRAEPACQCREDIGGLRAEDVARGVAAECRAEALILRTLQKHEQDNEQADEDVDRGEQVGE